MLYIDTVLDNNNNRYKNNNIIIFFFYPCSLFKVTLPYVHPTELKGCLFPIKIFE